MKDAVLSWLRAGANLTEGALLFKSLSSREYPLLRLLQSGSPAAAHALEIALCRLAGIDPLEKIVPDTAALPVVPAKPKLRENWPFLSDPACPPELKILAANKISAYHNYVTGHTKLFDCNNSNEQFAAIKFVVENYIENRAIIREFEFYKQHNRILGKHKIFEDIKQIRSLRKMKVIDLVKLQKKLEHNIWRIQSEINKKNKPQLDVERQRSIQSKQNQLAEIDRILEQY